MAFPFFLIPMAAQAIQAGIQGGKAKKQTALASKLHGEIPMNDPAQQGFLNKLAAQERQYRTGMDPNTSFANNLTRQAGTQTQANLVRSGGPGMVQNMLSSQNVTNTGLARNAATAAGMADNMLGMQNGLVNLMAQRRLDLKKYPRDLALMRGTQHQQNSNNLVSSLFSTLGTMSGNIGGDGTGTGMGTKSATAQTTSPAATGVPLRSAMNPALPMGNYIQPVGSSPTSPQPYYGPGNLTYDLMTPR